MILGIFHGEFDPGGFTQWEAQRYFFIAIMKEHPEVLSDLKRIVLPVFIKTIPCSWVKVKSDSQHQEVKEAILKWADKYNLNEDFVLDAAIKTMKCWYEAPSFAEFNPLQWSFSAKGYWPDKPVSVEERKIEITHPGWDPIGEREPWSIFEESFMLFIKDYLKEYRNRIDQKLTKTHQRTPQRNSTEPFSWLASFQVGGKSINRIAESVFSSRQNVTDRINDAANLCNIKLRPPNKPGRPREK